jgi:biotin operon repressor
MKPNPVDTEVYKYRKDRRKGIINHGTYIEITHRNKQKIAENAEVSRTTFDKMIKDLRARLAGLKIESLPDELRTAVNTALGGKPITDDLIRNKLPPPRIRELLAFLYKVNFPL